MEIFHARLTESGLEELRTRIVKLEEKIREHNLSIQKAIDVYGIHDEQYIDRVERKMHRERELHELKEILKGAIIVEERGRRRVRVVDIGRVVKLTNHRVCYKFQVVSEIEANPSIGKISAESPIGTSIIGKKVGEVVVVKLPAGEIELKISEIK